MKNLHNHDPIVVLAKVPELSAKDRETILDYEVVFKGPWSAAWRWAQAQGYTFIPDESVYGGYWRRFPEDCLVMC